jgi:hypothetical protein
VASSFAAHTIKVHLAKQSLLHIAKEHPEIFPDDILLLPKVIRSGAIFLDPQRPKHLTACCEHPTRQERWLMAGMKFTAATHELWVSTFHLAQRRHVERLEKSARYLGRNETGTIG